MNKLMVLTQAIIRVDPHNQLNAPELANALFEDGYVNGVVHESHELTVYYLRHLSVLHPDHTIHHAIAFIEDGMRASL